MRISDWSSDVCSSDLTDDPPYRRPTARGAEHNPLQPTRRPSSPYSHRRTGATNPTGCPARQCGTSRRTAVRRDRSLLNDAKYFRSPQAVFVPDAGARSEEHTSELQSLMRISYAVFCLNKKNNNTNTQS